MVRESAPLERRVALIPNAARELVDQGHAVIVETGAGDGSLYTDAAYVEAGAEIGDPYAADIVLAVGRPAPERLRDGQVVIAFLDPLGDPAGIARLAASGATALAIELVPRITRAQSMDALSSQATVAGYAAVLDGAAALPQMMPLLMTAAGTVTPAKVLVLGAGVAGLQAIATAKRLGAVVTAFDVRPAVREQVESLGGRFLEIDLPEDASAEGGYAKALSEEAHRLEQELVANAVAASDLVITTAAIPGQPAPKLITAEAVAAMRPGSVIVDIAAPTGGNCDLTRPGESIVEHGVTILGPLNMAARMPTDASQLYAKNLTTLLRHLAPEGDLIVDPDDEITRAMLVCRGGEIVNERVADALGARA